MFICNHTLACALGEFCFLRYTVHSRHIPFFCYPSGYQNNTADWLVNHAESAHLCVFRQENTCSKLFLELGIVVGAQILDMLQECLLVDRPDRREEEHLEGERNAPNNVTICYFLRAYFSSSICWSLQQHLSKYSQYFRLTWAISCSWAAWTKTDKLNSHTFMNL